MTTLWMIAMVCSLLLGAVPRLAAQLADVPLPTRIAVVDMNTAILATQEGKKVFEEVQKKFQSRAQGLERQQREVQALQERHQRQATTLSEQERRRLTRQLEENQRSLKRAQEDYQADSQQESQDAYGRLGAKMQRIINDYAAQNGYVLVVDYRQIPVYYIHKSIDITEDLVRRYDAANPSEAAVTPPPAGGGQPATNPSSSPPEKP